MEHIKLTRLIENMEVTCINAADIELEGKELWRAEVNRPAFQLTGYFEEFPHERVQVIGLAEYQYMKKMEPQRRAEIFEQIMGYAIPCFVFCRGLEPEEDFITIANKHNIPVLQSEKDTTFFENQLSQWMSRVAAPKIKMHGVLLDVYGEGVLITGESGLGKSEAALELLRRGHRLVADDVVEVHKMSETSLVGKAPELTKHFIELRGIGIVDVQTMFGVESVKETQDISFVIKLEEWDRTKAYDRIGLSEEYIYILGNRLVQHTIPIRPGRNLAVIVETAAANFRQKQLGYNASKELEKRMKAQLAAQNVRI